MTPSMRHKAFPRFSFLLFVAPLVMSLVVVFLVVRSLAASRKNDVMLAEAQTRNLAQAIDQNISGSLKRIDVVLLTVVSEIEIKHLRGSQVLSQIRAFTAAQERLMPEALAIRVTDSKGQVIMGKGGADPLAGYADYPAFPEFRDHPRAGLLISKPMLDLPTKKWVITSARRYNLANGRFGGIVAIPVPVEHFQKLLAGFNFGRGGMLTLRDVDCGFITRNPPFLKGLILEIGDKSVSPELQEMVRSGVPESTYSARTPFDQTRRTFTFRRLQGTPLIVLAGLAEDDYLAQWVRDRNTTVAVMVAFFLSLGITAWLIWHYWNEHEHDLLAIQKNERRANGLLEALPDLMFRLDHAGVFLDYKAEAGEAGTANPKDFVGRSCFEDMPRGLMDLMDGRIKAALGSGTLQTFHYQRTAPDGGHHHFEARMVPTGKDEVTTIVRDITERIRAEEARRHLQAKLQQAQKMENLGNLAGGVAHDMNNVLGAILGLSSAMIEAQEAGSPIHQTLQTIIRAAERGGKMVKGLLTFARQTPVEERALDMNRILQEEAHLLERTTLSKIRLVMNLTSDLLPIRGDACALTHLFMNLCVNAVDAMPENGTLTLRTRNLDNNWIEVMVEDTGTGMPKEILEKALDPFFTTKDVGKGTGLGLSMVYSTVMAHRGEIKIQSEPGQGTRVRMRFPACEVRDPEEQPPVEPPPQSVARVLNVLVVDDDELIRSSMMEILEMLGHKATTASSGEEALEKLEAGLQPDVVILDINMPGLGGVGTLPRLRFLRPTVPVLLCSGRVDDTALDLILANALVTLLPKPFSTRELQHHLQSFERP